MRGILVLLLPGVALAAEPRKSSYMPVEIEQSIGARLTAISPIRSGGLDSGEPRWISHTVSRR